MCSICGIVRLAGSVGPKDHAAVERMAAAMHHRGPDDRGATMQANAVLGMTRLAIQDPTPAGRQPMHSEDGLVSLVFNGELYNFHELRTRLEGLGHRFSSRSDTEVLLRLYQEEGDACVHRLRGMFAFCVHDQRKGPGRERLLLARDGMGIKPLLYAERDGVLCFASELKALLRSGMVPPEIDPAALRLLLTFGSVSQPRTMLRGVRMLRPGHLMVIENGKASTRQYFTLSGTMPRLGEASYAEQVQAVDALLSTAVRRQTISDRPVGAFLSGGLDSALLCALMMRNGTGELNTFSVGFGEEGRDMDESADAFATARHLGTRHHHLVVDGDEIASSILDIVRDLDQPTVDGVNSWFISKAARTHATVALSGTGSDEVFAGYPWFAATAAFEADPPAARARFTAKLLSHAAFDGLAPDARGPWLEQKRIDADFLSFFAQRYYILGPTGAARLLPKAMRASSGAGRAMRKDIAEYDELPDADALSRTSALCLRGYLGNQLLRDIDAASMAHSLEVRVPYLDEDLVGAALSLPPAAKMRGSAPTSYRQGLKRVLSDIALPLLPPDFGEREKRGFGMPFGVWLRGPLRAVYEDALGPASIRARGLLEPDAVREVRDAFEGGKIMWMKPWLLMVLELWCRQVLDAGGGE